MPRPGDVGGRGRGGRSRPFPGGRRCCPGCTGRWPRRWPRSSRGWAPARRRARRRPAVLTAPTPAKRSSSSEKTAVPGPAGGVGSGGRSVGGPVTSDRDDGPRTAARSSVPDHRPVRGGAGHRRSRVGRDGGRRIRTVGLAATAGQPGPRRDRPGGGAPRTRSEHAPDAGEVLPCGVQDVDPGVRVVDPVHRDFVNAQSDALSGHQHLGVEEPLVVLDEWQQLAGGVAPHGLESTLGVRAGAAESGSEEQVVAPRDELAACAPDHVGPGRQAGADGHVAVAGEQGGHQGEQGVEPGGQVHVHVGHHRGRAAATTPPARRGPGPSGRGAGPPRPEGRRPTPWRSATCRRYWRCRRW